MKKSYIGLEGGIPSQQREEQHTNVNGAVVTTVDDSDWEEFATNRTRFTKKNRVHIMPNGRASIYLPPEDITASSVILRLNKPGNIITLQWAELAIPIRTNKRGMKITSCKKLIESLKERNINLPADYMLTWDKKLNKWVGRLAR